MLLNSSILFISALLAGLAVFLLPNMDVKRFKVLLSFSGAYLFSITVIHILPELFHETEDIRLAGIYVLIGFFLQMILEYFTSGVEHGHIHVHAEDKQIVPYSLLVSLCLHAFLEGTLLVHPEHSHHHHVGEGDVQPLLFGLVLHKIPEAFALMSILLFRLERNKIIAIVLLIIFSMASPLGMFLSTMLYNDHGIAHDLFPVLFALVAGNFLYISTTIFFETSPNHKFKANRLIVSILGAAAAIIAEYFLQ